MSSTANPAGGRSRRDRILTIYGRQPVAEALDDRAIPVSRVFVAERAVGPIIERIGAAARTRGIELQILPDTRIALLAGNARHHQGVAADIAPPGLDALEAYLEGRRGRRHNTSLLLTDGVHNPSNLGMIIRSATAAGLDGVVIPHQGTAELGPLVIKASAGVALRATLLRSEDSRQALEALRRARFEVVALDGSQPDAPSLFDAELQPRAVYVLGNESTGLSPGTAPLVDRYLSIPLAGGVESLNVACAATMVGFEVFRRA
ncbi:MAG: TrmH family RNA methyltransferase [Acidimicrobiales bacterium]